jgi:hypothetical protein
LTSPSTARRPHLTRVCIVFLCATLADLDRRCLQARAVPSRRLPHDAAQGPLPYQNLPPKHRPSRPDLPGCSQECVANFARAGSFSLTFPGNWSPALQIRTILLSIQALLGAPNPDDPLANDVAQQWKEDQNQAIATAKEWTDKFAHA